MKVQLLHSTIDAGGVASSRQHLPTIVIDDKVAIDAGCLAFSCTDEQRNGVRDIILTHTHLDHIAGLPMFIDDLFATLERPVCVHATAEMIGILESHIFNWSIYPKFSELANSNGNVLEFQPFEAGSSFDVVGYTVRSVPVNHEVAACGYIVSGETGSVAISGDTAETDEFWRICSEDKQVKAVFVECAFPNDFGELARVSCHLTPERLAKELEKAKLDRPVFVMNLKPMYRDRVIAELQSLNMPGVEVAEVGRVYEL